MFSIQHGEDNGSGSFDGNDQIYNASAAYNKTHEEILEQLCCVYPFWRQMLALQNAVDANKR